MGISKNINILKKLDYVVTSLLVYGLEEKYNEHSVEMSSVYDMKS